MLTGCDVSYQDKTPLSGRISYTVRMERVEENHCFYISCCVRGHHVYKDMWRPVIGEQVETFCETGNSHDKHAVAVTLGNAADVVGHIPKEISKTCFYFIRHKGEITGEVTGRRKHRAACGGMEVPCRLKFYNANEDVLRKAKELITRKFELA